METYSVMTSGKKQEGSFINTLKGRCPRCGQGKFFESGNPYSLKGLRTLKECPRCHLNYVPEIGFYWGATYVAYALGVAFSVTSFVISTIIFGFMNSLSVTYIVVNGILLVLIAPLTFRFSRILWLWFFYDRE